MVCATDRSLPLLDDMGQLMCEGAPIRRAGPDHDMVPHGVSAGTEHGRRGRGHVVGVDADLGEIRAEPGLHLLPERRGDGLAGAAEHVVHGGAVDRRGHPRDASVGCGALRRAWRTAWSVRLIRLLMHVHGTSRSAATEHGDQNARQSSAQPVALVYSSGLVNRRSTPVTTGLARDGRAPCDTGTSCDIVITVAG